MIRSIVIAVFLPLALLESSISSIASASEPSDIGFVLYTRSDSPGTLHDDLRLADHRAEVTIKME